MKRNSSVLAIASILSGLYDIPSDRGKNSLTPKEIKINNKKIIPNGCKVFNINGINIIAINEKNALRKYNQTYNQNK